MMRREVSYIGDLTGFEQKEGSESGITVRIMEKRVKTRSNPALNPA